MLRSSDLRTAKEWQARTAEKEPKLMALQSEYALAGGRAAARRQRVGLGALTLGLIIDLRMEITAACVALERIDEGHTVTIYPDASYLVNCMRRGWYKKWRENGWLNQRNEPVANRDLWERLLQAKQRHHEVLWRKVRGHSKSGGPHKSGNDRADDLAVAAKKAATRIPTPPSL